MKEVKLYIDRHYDKKQTPGDLLLVKENITYKCKTLELPWLNNKPNISCIPEGIYTVKVRYSEKYKRHLEIKNVKNRKYILIHWGNYVGSHNPKTGKSDIEGCVLVGKSLKDINKDDIVDITSSKITFDKIMSMIEDDDMIKLEVCGNGGKYGPE